MVRLSARGYDLDARTMIEDPSQDELQRFTAAMPNARPTEFGNLNVQPRVDARSTASTYIITDDPASTSSQTISREEATRWARIQDEYIRGQDMLVING